MVRFARRFEPARERYFLARIELDPFGALDMQVAEEGSIPAGKGEPGHGRRYP